MANFGAIKLRSDPLLHLAQALVQLLQPLTLLCEDLGQCHVRKTGRHWSGSASMDIDAA